MNVPSFKINNPLAMFLSCEFLSSGLHETNDNNIPKIKQQILPQTYEFAINPNTAMLSRGKVINVKSASGKISAQNVYTCPPGIPIAMAGERLQKDNINALINYGIEYIKVLY